MKNNFDVMEHCILRESDGVYEVNPPDMFPAVIERIRSVRSGNVFPDELGGDGGKEFMRKYAGVRDEALDLALRPYSDFVSEDTVDTTQIMLLSLRAEALAFAENYFSRALSVQAGKGIRIHILRDESYRR